MTISVEQARKIVSLAEALDDAREAMTRISASESAFCPGYIERAADYDRFNGVQGVLQITDGEMARWLTAEIRRRLEAHIRDLEAELRVAQEIAE